MTKGDFGFCVRFNIFCFSVKNFEDPSASNCCVRNLTMLSSAVWLSQPTELFTLKIGQNLHSTVTKKWKSISAEKSSRLISNYLSSSICCVLVRRWYPKADNGLTRRCLLFVHHSPLWLVHSFLDVLTHFTLPGREQQTISTIDKLWKLYLISAVPMGRGNCRC